MSLRPQNVQLIRNIVRDRMIQSGVDNYTFVDGQLKIGSTRYAVDPCGCGEPECDGIRLRRVQDIHVPYVAKSYSVDRPVPGISLGGADGTA